MINILYTSALLVTVSSSKRQIIYSNIIGILDPPTNISVMSSEYSIIHFKWIPPFTLKVNNSSRLIKYEVVITDSANDEDLIEVVMQPEYMYHRRDYEHCAKVRFQVAAINEVGKSNRSEGIEAGFFGRKQRLETLILICNDFRLTMWLVKHLGNS